MTTSSAPLVNALGMTAGGIWMCAALYFQMVRHSRTHPAYIAAAFLIGVALMMSSSALVVRGPGTIVTLAVIANTIFCILGLGAWVALIKASRIRESKEIRTTDHAVAED